MKVKVEGEMRMETKERWDGKKLSEWTKEQMIHWITNK
jgi:hypothetical protein